MQDDQTDSFVIKQLHMIASDLVHKPQENRLSSEYFKTVSESLGKLLEHGTEASHITALLLAISRPARIAECLEVHLHVGDVDIEALRSPDGTGSGNDSDQTLPRYIKAKLEQHFGSTEEAKRVATRAEGGDPNTSVLSASGAARRDTPDAVPVPAFLQTGDKLKRADFEFKKLISSGAFGSVYLAQHVTSNEIVAVKVLPKKVIKHKNLVAQVFKERNIMKFASNPFLVEFYGSFTTKNCLFMVMEFIHGGDVAALLLNIGCLDEVVARQYMAETVLAVEYIHEYGITHRDLKPDNLVITASGHIKLTDFGLSQTGLMTQAVLIAERTGRFWDHEKPSSNASGDGDGEDKSAVGTPGYMAPESILGLSCGKSVDWWAMGVIAFEMLAGYLPFSGDTHTQMFEDTINGRAMYPEGEDKFSPTAETFIKELLVKNADARLGSLGSLVTRRVGGGSRNASTLPASGFDLMQSMSSLGGAAVVKSHSFFAARPDEGVPDAIDWGDLLHKKVAFVPELDGDLDTSYFDDRSDR